MKTPKGWKYLLLCLAPLVFPSCDNGKDLRARAMENDVYFEENSQKALERLTSVMYQDPEGKKGERFKLVQISDPHLSDYSPSGHYEYPINLIQAVRFANHPEARINALVATGDLISFHEDREKALDFMRSFAYFFHWDNAIPSFACTGNHDSNQQMSGSFRQALTKNDIHEILFATNTGEPSRHQPAGENYYYVDLSDPQGGTIRLIALDMLDQNTSRYRTIHDAIFSDKQIDWLIRVALKEGMSDAHRVIVLTHYPFQPYSGNASTYLCDGDFVHPWKMIPEIIEAFRAKSVWKKTYANRVIRDDSLRIDADFNGCPGEFICYLGGHAHCDATFLVEDLENRAPSLPAQRMFLCTNLAPSEQGEVYNRKERREDTPSSNSFRLYAIDTQERAIYATHFGNDAEAENINVYNY